MKSARFEDVYELSPMQQGLLFHTLYDPAGDVYFEQCVVGVGGDLNSARFARAWQRVAARHPILRTSFHWEGLEKPVQVVHPKAEVPFESHDWRGLAPDVRRDRFDAFLREDRKRSFDLATAPLLRVTLLRMAEDLHEFVLSFQHLLLDRWSRMLVLKEVFAEYAGGTHGDGAPLSSPRGYGEYIAWLQEQDRSGAEAFWRNSLAGFTTPTSLAFESRSGKPNGSEFEEAKLRLSTEATAALQSFARRNRLTMNTLVQGAWAVLASRYRSEEDVLFGATVSGRPASLPGIESIVGLFVNSLPVRVRVPAQKPLLPWLQEFQGQLLELREYEYSSLVDIQGWSEVPRGTPLFESLVVFENVGGDADSVGGVGPLEVLRVRSVGSGTSYPLTLFAFPGPQLSFRILADRAFFEDGAASRMLGHLETLLTGMPSEPDRPLSRLPMLTEAERRQVLFEWNNTGRDYPAVCIHQLFEAQAERTPDADAVVFGNERVTYRDLNCRANRVAHHLERLGAGPETLVAICLERSVEMVAGLLGILKAGAAYVALDPAYPADRLGFMIQDAQPTILLTEQSVAGRFPRFEGRTVLLDRDREAIAEQSPENPEGAARPSNLAYLIYTSGSTGKPKGVAIEHHSTVAVLAWAKELFSREELEGVLASTSICFDLSVFELFVPLAWGGKVVIAQNALELPQLPAAGEVRLVNTVPSAMTELLRMGELPESVTTVNLAGEPLAASLVREILRRGKVQRVFDLYGPTEDTTYSTCARRSAEGPATIGRPISNKRSYILDAQLQPVPVGVPGDLFVAGAGVARGYLNRPELTAERFLPDPFGAAGERMYRTGDRARFLPGGDIQFLGRLDNQVKLRGYRIELGEVETVLTQHPAVRDAVALVREDGAERARLVAYVIPSLPDSRSLTQPTDSQGSQADQLSQWRSVWEQLYTDTTGPDPEFNIVGWNSSYTAEPMSAEAMHEWVDTTVERILSLDPKNVLEIGCGTGLLLLPIAPHCAAYTGTDFSRQILAELENVLKLKSGLPPVQLLARSAEDFEGIPRRAFDTVVLNSVVQYFPDVEYLVRVLEGAVEALSEGGAIFVGDVRNLPLLEAFHLSVGLERASASLPLEELRRRVRRNVAQEEELVLDPGFFSALRRHLPRIERVEVLPKAGRCDNELNRYRYDVILRVGPLASSPTASRWLNWGEEGLTLAGLRRILEGDRPDVLAVRDVPNARVARDVRAVEWMQESELPRTVGEMRSALERLPDVGVSPAELWSWSSQLPYRVDLSWSSSTPAGAFDTAFVSRARPEAAGASVVFPGESGPARSWHAYANNPLWGSVVRKLLPNLRAFLRERLPEYMVPSAIVVLDEFPVTLNGKVDRRALPSPDQPAGSRESAFLPPRTPVEKTLAQIWKELLALDRVGIRDNFFELGGHSLLATQLVSRVAESFSVRLPLRRVFEDPTLEGLSLGIADSLAEAERPESMLQMLAEIRDLSDEEADSRRELEANRAGISPDRPGR